MASVETEALSMAGFHVTLLTFDGMQGEKLSPRVEHITILSGGVFSAFIRYISKIFNHWIPTHLIVMFFETFLTLLKAVLLKKREKFDIIHLRDGDPFIFLVLFFSFFLRKYEWVVHMILDPSKGILQKINYAKLWRPIYRHSLLRNRFVFLCENMLAKGEYEKCMDGLFAKRVIYLPHGTQYVGRVFPKEEARQLLGLPKNKTILLCFGSFHSGKDLRVVAHALKELPDVYLVLAGKAALSTIDEVKAIKKHLIARNYYIPQEEKPLYFSAADAVVLSYRKTFLNQRTAGMLWEACKFGTTIIASDGGQLGELTTLFQVGLLFEPENAPSLRKTILRFLNLKEEELRILKRNCKIFCTEFSMERWSKRCQRIFNYVSSGAIPR